MESLATMAPEISEDMMAGALGGGILGMSLGVIITIALVLYVIQVIAYWQMFKKMGEPGWKSIIPVYNSYIMFKRTWKPMWFWVNLLIGFVAALLSNLNTSFGPSTVIAIISAIVLIIGIVFGVIADNKISKSFGHGAGYTVGLIFLPMIFTLILGFGKSQYKGADL